MIRSRHSRTGLVFVAQSALKQQLCSVVFTGELKKVLEQTQGGTPWVFQEVIEAQNENVSLGATVFVLYMRHER